MYNNILRLILCHCKRCLKSIQLAKGMQMTIISVRDEKKEFDTSKCFSEMPMQKLAFRILHFNHLFAQGQQSEVIKGEHLDSLKKITR